MQAPCNNARLSVTGVNYIVSLVLCFDLTAMRVVSC